MVRQIAPIINILMSIVSNEMGMFTKADTTDFEQIPAIGFGVPFINEVPELSQTNKKDVEIPIVIVDAGTHPLVSITLTQIYEDLEDALKGNIENYLSAQNITVDAVDFGNFRPMPISQDTSQKGLEGSITFRITS
jgi:hypothetical protein